MNHFIIIISVEILCLEGFIVIIQYGLLLYEFWMVMMYFLSILLYTYQFCDNGRSFKIFFVSGIYADIFIALVILSFKQDYTVHISH
jgi:hypothetical protein